MNFSLLRLLDFLNCAELLDKLVFSCFLFIYKYIKKIYVTVVGSIYSFVRSLWLLWLISI